MERGERTNGLDMAALKPPPFDQTPLARLAEDIEPVRPLRSPLRRALGMSVLALVAGTLALVGTGVRSDLGSATWAVTYGPAVGEMAAGIVIFWLSMRWAVPGSGAVHGRTHLYLAMVLGLALGGVFLSPHLAGPDVPAVCSGGVGAGLPCLGWELALAMPLLLLASWLIYRGASIASPLARALAGLGAGLVSDAAIHLHCGAVETAHTLPWHFGGMVLLVGLGALIGRLLPRW